MGYPVEPRRGAREEPDRASTDFDSTVKPTPTASAPSHCTDRTRRIAGARCDTSSSTGVAARSCLRTLRCDGFAPTTRTTWPYPGCRCLECR